MAKRSWNLGAMSLEELSDMRGRIDQVLKSKAYAERSELERRLQALNALGLTGGATSWRAVGLRKGASNGRRGPHPLKGRKAPIKYRGPNGEKWSGRGLAPRWLVALEKKGKKRESFLI